MPLTFPRRLGAALAVAAAALPATASAGPPIRDAFHVEDTYVLEDYCGQPGLDVRVGLVLDVRVHAVARGRGGLVYFLQHGTRTETLTNTDGGATLTSRAMVIEKDLRVTDNGDGTLTALVLATGNAVLYDDDGKAIARNPGQVRLRLVVDHGGTPGDPADDAVIANEVVRASTGRSDDFCDAAVPALR